MLLGAMLVGFVACEKDQEPIVNNNDGDKTEEEEKPFVDKSTVVNGHEAVDLGLSVLWATCNIGATSPEKAGEYYSWGAIKSKSDYNWATYEHGDSCKLTKYGFDISSINEKGNPVVISYWDRSAGEKCDSISTLEQGDDAAYEKWRGAWRMPTADELHELHSKCTCTWTTQNGVKGMVFTSTINNKSIFLPAAGYKDWILQIKIDEEKKDTTTWWETKLLNEGECGGYWSSSLYLENPNKAQRMHITSGNVAVEDICFRYMGQTIRAVCPYQ